MNNTSNEIILDDKSFWKWMEISHAGDTDGINKYLKIIADNEVDKEYVVELMKQDIPKKTSSIMNNLRQCMPRSYFEEIQFCAGTYATILGKIFPPLVPQIDQLAYIEWLLYTEPGYLGYRDHLVHMFKVAFVGYKLFPKLMSDIVEWQFSSEHFHSWCKKSNIDFHEWETSEKENVVQMAFFMAALFHDFGYGYFFLKKYKQRLFKLYEWLLPGADPADIDTPGTQSLLKSLPAFFIEKHHGWLTNTSENRDNVIAGFFRDCLPLNHSIASAFFVLDIAEKLSKSRALNQKLYVAFQLAAEACMIHDMTDDNNWVHLEKRKNGHFIEPGDHKTVPLAMLLILADELSVWNRPRLKIEPDGADKVYNQLDRNEVPHKIDIEFYRTEKNNQCKIRIKSDRKQDKIKDKFDEELKCLKDNKKQKKPKILDCIIHVM